MSKAKKLLKSKNVRAWGITTIALTAFLVTANILVTNTFNDIICNVLGGKRAITADGEAVVVYEKDFDTKNEALENGNAVTKKICEEGMVLLKNENNALPLKANAKVSVFGKNSVKLVYGGSGSAEPTQENPKKTIFDSLTAAGIEFNPTLKNFYEDNSKSGSGRSSNPDMENSGVPTLETGETAISKYGSNITSSYDNYKDAALVVFSRIAGENWDLPRVASDDSSKHYLQLDGNERALLKHICDSNKFEHIIVLINSSNNIDLGFLKLETDPDYNSKIDGAILVGSPGANGIMALGEILAGTVNPSGHTIDTLYTHYEKDPTWQNFGDNLRDNGDAYTVNGTAQSYYFVDYEENIYMGYRYYETRGKIEGETWYNNNVIYPFGYGLSYTTFSKTLVNKSQLEGENLAKGKKFTVEVKVKNTGTVAGKEVVQLYASAPYTSGGIEKAYKTLVGFAKTKLLAPNEEETVKITVTPYDFASYDAKDKNGNGFKGYELEKGDYTFFVGENAHKDIDSFTKAHPEDERFETDPVTNAMVQNLFDGSDAHLQSSLSRNNFESTFPKAPTAEDCEVTSAFIAEEKNYDSGNKEDLSVMPKTGEEYTDENGEKYVIRLKELIGKDYDDPLWDKFLDQMTFQEMVNLFNKGSYSTTEIERLGVPKTLSCDGPTGIVSFMGTPEVYGTCYYCSECLVAQTYNLELAELEGNAIGNEALLGDQRPGGSNLPYTGWYATGVNLHRSPFGGRNTEYYSEDPFISGKFAARVIEAAQEKGVYTTVKHFALNEQETHRSTNGQNYWCEEQAIRELYLKPFEFAVKEGKSKGVMSAFTRIGQKWTGGSYNLLTSVLRKEWGFVGLVICDFHTDDYMNNRQMIYAGGDLNLTGTKYWSKADPKSAADVNVLRRSSHNILYTLANSNAVQYDIVGYKLPVWQELFYVGDGVVGGLLLVWGGLAIFFALRKKEDPAADVPASE